MNYNILRLTRLGRLGMVLASQLVDESLDERYPSAVSLQLENEAGRVLIIYRAQRTDLLGVYIENSGVVVPGTAI